MLYRNHLLDGFTRGDRASAAREIATRERIGIHAAMRRLRAMSHLARQADLGVEPLGHHGLDADAYAWFTSPLRRYADLASLRALVHGVHDDDIVALANRLSGIHRSQIESGDEHHGRASRKRLLPLLAKGAHKELDATDVHVIVRALTENPGFDQASAMRHLGRRMAADTLSGRDIAALADNVQTLFGDEAMATVTEWIGQGPRALLLAEYRAGGQPPTATKPDGINHKGALFELSQARRAQVRFGDPVRTGTAHAPIFTVTATWRLGDETVEGVGMERTIRNAEQAAAKAVLEGIAPAIAPKAARPATKAPATRPPSPPAPGGVAPKTRLLELAVATGAVVTFGEPREAGPPHARRFSVEARHTLSGSETRTHGEGTSKREAERRASEEMLRRLGVA